MFWFYTDIIAFDAELKSPLKGIRSGQKIIFPVIRENIGGGYDAGNGVFTAPLSGVYVFQWTTVVTELVSTETVLVVDGKRRALNKCNSNKANNDSCTKITIVKLAPGERVWIKCILGNSSINDYESSSFIGFRLWNATHLEMLKKSVTVKRVLKIMLKWLFNPFVCVFLLLATEA